MTDYTPQTWVDGPAGGTPITAADLNRIDRGVKLSLDLQTRQTPPSGGGGPVQIGSARVNISAPATTHNAFPGAVMLQDRSLLLCWRGGPAHTGGTNGRIFLARSGDLGHTWSTPVEIYDNTLDVRDPSLAISGDGETLWLTFFTYNSPGDPQLKSWIMRSTDDGETWTTPVRITSQDMAIAAPVVEISPNVILAAIYGPVSARDSVMTARSTDGGVTWEAPVLVANGAGDSRDYQEPWLVKTPTNVTVYYRWNNVDGIARSTSTNGGATWTSASRLFDGTGRPSLVRTSTGATICIYRQTSTFAAVMRVSRDEGATWSTESVFDAATVQMAYASPVEVSDGVVAVPYALEQGAVSSTVSNLHLRYVMDGSGISPFGDVSKTAIDAVQSRKSTILAWDNFDRADGALTTTPSGASWTTTNSIQIVDGNLRTTTTGVALAYVTLANGNHDVEADVQWINNTGPAVLIRGVSNTTYLMAALESGAATNLRLYKMVDGTATQLATVSEPTRSGQWITLTVSAYDSLIRVFIDGTKVISHTLASGDETTFAPATARRAGFRFNAPSSSNSSAARRFVVRSS